VGFVRSNMLPVVTVRELSRSPATVFERVARGERLIVARHGRPIATLQPLDGVVVQPLTRAQSDVRGVVLGDAEAELEKLTEIERDLLRDGGRWDRLYPGHLSHVHALGDLHAQVRAFGVRGLARKAERGWVLTGRGMILRELLLAQAGRTDELLRSPRSSATW